MEMKGKISEGGRWWILMVCPSGMLLLRDQIIALDIKMHLRKET